ncbi:MAG: hypothetical protein K8T91_06775 [Planctomycetes bacterium]|nr:hypothetical protein [Planctomycetota bacterium]
MPRYLIEQYEIHSQSFRVDAENEALAIKKLFDGQAQPEDNGLEYIEVANDLGLPADTYPDLAKELRELGIDTDDVIPSIRDIIEVD